MIATVGGMGVVCVGSLLHTNISIYWTLYLLFFPSPSEPRVYYTYMYDIYIRGEFIVRTYIHIDNTTCEYSIHTSPRKRVIKSLCVCVWGCSSRRLLYIARSVLYYISTWPDSCAPKNTYARKAYLYIYTIMYKSYTRKRCPDNIV